MGDDENELTRETARQAGRAFGFALSLLTLLFVVRVAGQAIQRWLPLPFLPAFDAFQGSGLPYWLLLSAQVLILGVMVRTSWRTYSGSSIPSARVSRIAGWAGAVYMAVSLGRILIGLAVPGASPWFKTWIPAFFHLVLAAFVLVVAAYHRNGSRA